MNELEQRLQHELSLLEYPPKSWVIPASRGVYDVIIIGAGMAGLAAGFALLKEGIHNICIVDASPAGIEGPWDTYARMLTLRSGKNLAGPALGIPSLTFQAWYTAQYGKDAWANLYKIPTSQWMDYLRWYRRVLKLPVHNRVKVEQIVPDGPLINLRIQGSDPLRARKVILATGRAGFGGVVIPSFMQEIPSSHYAHTCDQIDFAAMPGKLVAIIGVGASGFDAAAVCLEHGAKQVSMLVRRKKIPNVNKALSLTYAGFTEGYYQLNDQTRWNFMSAAYQTPAPPPHESLNRVNDIPNLVVETEVDIQQVRFKNQVVTVETTKGKKIFDFIILATGFQTDGSKQPELSHIYPHMLLWGDLALNKMANYPSAFDRYPYLGPHFQFSEKQPSQAPFLKNIYCFNYAAVMSHGQLSGDIPGISIGAERLAKGIAADFLINGSEHYLDTLRAFNTPEFEEDAYSFLQR